MNALCRIPLACAALTVALAAASSCQPAGGEAADQASSDANAAGDVAHVDGVRYQLHGCRLRTSRGDVAAAELELPMQGDCRFVRDRSGGVQQLAADGGNFALVMTSTPHDHDRFCDTRIRAVRLDPDRPAASEDEQRIRSCSRGPYDEKMLIVLSQSISAEQ